MAFENNLGIVESANKQDFAPFSTLFFFPFPR